MNELGSMSDLSSNLVSEIKDYAIFLLDVDGNVCSWNLGAEIIEGYNSEEIIGKNFEIFYSKADRAKGIPHQILAEAKETGRVERQSWRIRRNGTRFWAHVVVTILYDDAGEVSGYIKITKDLTEQRLRTEHLKMLKENLEKQVEERTRELIEIRASLEETVQKRTQELYEINNELKAFSYSVSHDLKAPLRAISGYSGILLQSHSKELNADGRVVAETIIRNVRRMEDLIENILRYSQISSQQVSFETVDMKRLFQTCWNTLTGDNLSNRIVKFNVGDSMPHAKGDSSMLAIMITNLLSNALKFTKTRKSALVEVGSKMVNKETVYYVKDNGVGFNEKYSSKLFEVFQRLHKDVDFEGTGVGLAIVRRIVIKHGGRIWGESHDYKGATFNFIL